LLCLVDCIVHNILLSKLKLYGVTAKSLPSIKSYLVGRHQRMILSDKYANHNTYSDWGKIKYGFPQAAIICFSYFTLMTYKKSHKINLKYFFLQMTIV